MWDLPRWYISACSNSVQYVRLHPILMSILLYDYKQLTQCITEVERIESRVNIKKEEWSNQKKEEEKQDIKDEESFTITVQDTTEPDVEITEAVDRSGREIVEGTGSSRTPIPYIRITFEATDAVGIDSTECSLDGGAFTSCTSPVVYNRLSRGTHEVIVRATDEAGNTGEDQFTWTVGSPPSSIGGSRNR
jgi:hypothetical protein